MVFTPSQLQSASNALAGKSDSSMSSANFFDGLANQFTGNLDYQRQLELLQKEMSFNAMEAQKQRDYSQMMDSSSYQRVVDDMRKAGLNPYLAYNSGGANTTATTAASVGSHSAIKSGQGFSTIVGLMSAMMKGMVQASNSMLTANNAMQIAQMNNMLNRDYLKMHKDNSTARLQLDRDYFDTYLKGKEFQWYRNYKQKGSKK